MQGILSSAGSRWHAGVVEGRQRGDTARRSPKKWNHFLINLKIYRFFWVLRLRKNEEIMPGPQKSKKVESLFDQLEKVPLISSFAVKKRRKWNHYELKPQFAWTEQRIFRRSHDLCGVFVAVARASASRRRLFLQSEGSSADLMVLAEKSSLWHGTNDTRHTFGETKYLNLWTSIIQMCFVLVPGRPRVKSAIQYPFNLHSSQRRKTGIEIEIFIPDAH